MNKQIVFATGILCMTSLFYFINIIFLVITFFPAARV